MSVLRTFRPNVPVGGDPSKFQVYEIGAHYSSLEKHFQRPTTGYEPMTLTRLRTILQNSFQNEEPTEEEEINALMPDGDTKQKKSFMKKKKDGKMTVRKSLVSGAAEYGAQLIEQIIRISHVDGDTLISKITPDSTHTFFKDYSDDIDSESILRELLEGFNVADEIVKSCGGKGFITTSPSKDADTKDPVYDEFMPFQPIHLNLSTSLLEFDTVSPHLPIILTL